MQPYRQGFIAMLFGITLLAGCSWVEITDQAREVRILEQAQVVNCQKLGTTSVKTLYKLWIIKRDDYAIAGELIDLARNEAVKLGGNTVAAINEPQKGMQDFAVYRCP